MPRRPRTSRADTAPTQLNGVRAASGVVHDGDGPGSSPGRRDQARFCQLPEAIPAGCTFDISVKFEIGNPDDVLGEPQQIDVPAIRVR
jgi:hypothetical protein